MGVYNAGLVDVYRHLQPTHRGGKFGGAAHADVWCLPHDRAGVGRRREGGGVGGCGRCGKVLLLLGFPCHATMRQHVFFVS